VSRERVADGEKPILKVLDGAVMPRPPIWFMRQAGRYLPEYRAVRAKAGGFVELCLNPEMASEVTLQPVRRFGLDAAIIFSDILIVPFALGVKLWFEEGEGPRLDPVDDAKSFDRMSDALAPEITGPVYEALRRVRQSLPADVALIGFCGAPWTVATYLIAGRGTSDQAPAKAMMREEPELFAKVIDRLAVSTAQHLIGQIDAGADVVQLFDTWAGSLERNDYQRWCVEPAVRIVETVRNARPGARVILFPKGASLAGLDSLVKSCGPNAISLDPDADRIGASKAFGGRCALQGNLSPELLLAGGHAMDREIDRILEDFRGARHIFNLGHGILKETPIENVERMIARVRGGG
jgi:uroporphyrinogen decarboxylase